MTKPIVNLTESNRDYAVFLPSISSFYNNIISRYHHDSSYFPEDRIPAGLEYGLGGCNFLNKDDSYFQYKWGLYSAGHAARDVSLTDLKDWIIQSRDRDDTFILGDSGGFQIVTGVIKCDWKNFKSDDSLRKEVLSWLEHTSDYSMILDIPTLATMPQYSERTGITDFKQCLDYTMFNNDWFVKNRTYNTKLLNVMQGMNETQSKAWYEAVKHYPFEGWSFSGAAKTNQIDILLRRLIEMRDDKLLEQGERDLIHLLGVGKLELGVLYTTLKRVLREHVNPDMEVTFDAASPFIGASKGEIYTESSYTSDTFRLQSERMTNDKTLSGSDSRLPWTSPIADRLTVGDMCYYADGMNDKNGKEAKTSWDSLTYALMQGHNTFKHIDSIQRANAYADLATHAHDTNHKHWTEFVGKDKKKKGNLDLWVPDQVIYLSNFIEDLFKSETPMSMIDEADALFTSFSKKKTTKNTEQTFNSFFTFGDEEEDVMKNVAEELESDASEEFLNNMI